MGFFKDVAVEALSIAVGVVSGVGAVINTVTPTPESLEEQNKEWVADKQREENAEKNKDLGRR